jgi:hypothetical protein
MEDVRIKVNVGARGKPAEVHAQASEKQWPEYKGFGRGHFEGILPGRFRRGQFVAGAYSQAPNR